MNTRSVCLHQRTNPWSEIPDVTFIVSTDKGAIRLRFGQQP